MNHYKLWRYLLILLIVALGLLYALPNCFGEDPAIQISKANAQSVDPDFTQRIQTTLKQAHLAYRDIQLQTNQRVMIRFNQIQQQLAARDALQHALGSDYVIALNLASRTPAWLRAIGAEPMKLGLDLRGGIHFLLQVDTSSMLATQLATDLSSAGQQLRDKQVRYQGLSLTGQSIRIQFASEAAQLKASQLLGTSMPQYQGKLATSADRHYLLTLTLSDAYRQQLVQQAVAQNLNILRNRVNELGIGEPVIQQQGASHISVDLPGVQDTARAKNIIGKVATIRLQLVDLQHDIETIQQTGIVPFGSTRYAYEGHQVLLSNTVILKGSAITNAASMVDDNGRPAVSIQLAGSQVPYFNRMTSEHVGQPLATVYVETKTHQLPGGTPQTVQTERLINVATIQSALGANFQITGLSSMEEAKNLALLLRSGAYTAPVSFVQERVVGPSLGRHNIEMGVLSCLVGSGVIILFMLIYYRVFGLVANLAIILNIVLLIAVMSLLGATLTLPGIAGIVLTVGMAVDANVLINERIREELRNGSSIQASIYAGYAKAFSTIVDANITTLIVALVLYSLGTGSIQGFAVTLTIGLLTSMFTAIFFTRGLVNWVYGRKTVRSISIGI